MVEEDTVNNNKNSIDRNAPMNVAPKNWNFVPHYENLTDRDTPAVGNFVLPYDNSIDCDTPKIVAPKNENFVLPMITRSIATRPRM